MLYELVIAGLATAAAVKGAYFFYGQSQRKKYRVCKVCGGTGRVYSFSKPLNMQFENSLCYACEGKGALQDGHERLNDILNTCEKDKQSDIDGIKNIESELKLLENRIPANKDLVLPSTSEGVASVIQSIRLQLDLMHKRVAFYTECERKIHLILYNRFLVHTAHTAKKTLFKYAKENQTQYQEATHLKTMSEMEKDIWQEANALHTLMQQNLNLEIADELRSDIEWVTHDLMKEN